MQPYSGGELTLFQIELHILPDPTLNILERDKWILRPTLIPLPNWSLNFVEYVVLL